MILDVAPDPVGMGALLAVILLVIGFIVLLAVDLFCFSGIANAACVELR
jgi:hypothetical protein